MRFPAVGDLRSDTVKTLGVIAFVQFVEAVFQLLGTYQQISLDLVDLVITGSPYLTVVLTYIAVFYRVNVKTDL